MALTGRKALITGAARGIGFEIALSLAKQGCEIIIVDLNLEGAQKAADSLKEQGYRADAFGIDVSNVAAIRDLMAQVKSRHQRLDIMVNNAGICLNTPLDEITEAEWDKVLAVNLKSTFFMCQAAAPLMKERGWGRIINISSIAGKMGALVAGCHYTVSKSGVIGVTKVFARHLSPHGITVNAVAPGTIDTAMTADWTPEEKKLLADRIPVGRLGLPTDIAAAVAFLASEEACFVTGATLDVNGGALMD